MQSGQRYLPLTGHIGLRCIVWHQRFEKEVQNAFITLSLLFNCPTRILGVRRAPISSDWTEIVTSGKPDHQSFPASLDAQVYSEVTDTGGRRSPSLFPVGFHYRNVAKVAVKLLVIEAESDHKTVWDFKAPELHRGLHDAARASVQQSTDR